MDLIRLKKECKRVEKTFPFKTDSIFVIYYLAFAEIKHGANEEDEIDKALTALSELENDLAEVYFARGTQIIYSPQYANGNGCKEYGFVTSISRTGSIFCRFFRKSGNIDELRTRANSESCNIRDLIIYKHHSRRLIDILLKRIKDGTI